MFDKLSILAQDQATRLSRRAFFSNVARAALPLAAAMGGLSALPRDARAIEIASPRGGMIHA